MKCFVTKELMRWPGIEALYGPTVRQSPVFSPSSTLGKKSGANAEGKKAEELENPGEHRWEDLHKRVVEHVSQLPKADRPQADMQNIRVVAKYYDRITLARLTELLDLPPLTTERTLCKLVTDKIIYARMNRSSGIVTFKPKTNTADILNAWTADIDKMLGLVEKTSHLVSKVS